MKIFIFTVILLVSSAFAQETTVSAPEGSAVNVGNCNAGVWLNDSGVVTQNMTQETCDFSTSSCQTKYEVKENYLKVDRECKQTEACENNINGAVTKCFNGENNIRICFTCCESDLCNDSVTPPPTQ